MANGAFLGGAATGIAGAERRGLARQSLSENVRLREAGLGLQERGLGLQERRFGADVRLREEALGLQERQIANAEKRQSTLDASKELTEDLSTITGIVDAGIESGDLTKMNRALAAAKNLIDSGAKRFSAAGRDPERFKTALDARVAAATTPTERARTEGTAAAVKSGAQKAELEKSGASPRAAAKAAGIAEPPITLRTFELPGGAVRSIRADDAQGIQEVLAQGGVETPRQRTAATIPADPTLISQKQLDKTREAIRSSGATMDAIERTRQAFEDNPEAGGLLGLAIDKLGGFVQSLPGIGDPIVKAVGVDPAAVTDARSKAIQLVSRTLKTITGDESGRYTDTERRIADEALKTLSPTASNQQIMAALNSANEAELGRQTRKADQLRLGAKISNEALNTVEGIERLGTILQQNGLTEDQALEAVDSLRKRLGLVGKRT